MDKLTIQGGYRLEGEISASGSKNATLAILAASLLTDADLLLDNVPDLSDTHSMCRILEELGSRVDVDLRNGRVSISNKHINNLKAPYDLVRKMRASFLVLGALLTKFGYAEVSLPGGCAIGTRPVDQHLYALQVLGADIELTDGYVRATATNGLSGGEVNFDIITVNGTQNALYAAVLASGTTVINNAALEPEVTASIEFLRALGANIRGGGTSTLIIEGVARLHGGHYRIPPDRIEVGTYLAAAASSKGNITVRNSDAATLTAVVDKLRETGSQVTVYDQEIALNAENSRLNAISITTSAYPGFPTDLQAQFMALNCVALGTSRIQECIFENRFMHVQELVRLGANITIESPSVATVNGVKSLKGAEVMATDLRASSSLVIAGLIAEGTTTINRIYHLDRGYENLEGKLTTLGAQVKRSIA